MSQRVLFFFPHNLFVSQTGAHQRGLEMLAAMAELGYKICLFSSVVSTDASWQGYSSGPLKGRACEKLILHEPTLLEAAYLWAGKTAYHILKRWSRKVAGGIEARSLALSALCPESMRREFREAIASFDPDIIFMNYAWWDGLLDHAQKDRERLTVVDTIDLVSVSVQLRSALEQAMPRGIVSPEHIAPEILREDFFDSLRDPGERLQIECNVYEQYDVSIAISKAEGEIIRQKTRKTQVVTIPMTRTPVYVANSYSGPALFAAGMNPFNVHGYAYFVSRVLPLLRTSAPDFVLEVTGTVCGRLAPAENVRLRGMVDRLDQVYAQAPFLVNPVYGGTGQQVKIVDAMAHGVPVIALDRAAEGSPIRHGENGLVAKDAREFADCVATLWGDRALCRRLGTNARATIADECSPLRLKNALETVFQRRSQPQSSTAGTTPP